MTNGTASNDADFNDSWYQGLNNGKWASLPIAAWGPVFLAGRRRQDLGQVAGGGSSAVGCRQGGFQQLGRLDRRGAEAEQEPDRRLPARAVHQHRQGIRAEVRHRAVPVPGDEPDPDDPAFVDQESDFYGGQKVNEQFAEISKTVSPDFGWLPFMDYVYTNFNETLGKAFADKTDAVAGLQAWQDALAKYAKDQGFTVA